MGGQDTHTAGRVASTTSSPPPRYRPTEHPICPAARAHVLVPFMPHPPSAAAAHLAAIIDLLCQTAAARIAGGRLAGPLIVLICTRLRRMAARFAAHAARAGTPSPPPRNPGTAKPRPALAPKTPALPRRVAWLLRLVPETAAGASQLQNLLAGPEMAALVAAAPQTGRVLRPLCRILGVRPPAFLVLPPPVPRVPPARAATAEVAAPAGPSPSPPHRKEPVRMPPILLRACGPPRGLA